VTSRRTTSRRGLAPLEFVLWLPILLFVAALMVNFGTMAAWRVRGEVASRDAVWRVRWPRTGLTEPRPEQKVWPAGAKMNVVADDPITNIDIPQIQHPVVRGPLPNDFVVQPTLDPDRNGALKGESSIVRRYPFFGKLGKFESGNIENSLFDRKWRIPEMGIRSNRSRRIPHIYELPTTDSSLPNAFLAAVESLFAMVNFEALTVLYPDEELRQLLGYRVDFHPRVNSRYQRTDPKEVRELAVKPLVDRLDSRGRVRLGQISRLPRRMTSTFLSAYQRAISSMEAQIDALQQQLDSGTTLTSQQRKAMQEQIQSLQSEIDILKPKVEQLEAYRDQLPKIESDLKQRYLDYLNSGI
jgi:hypothetical protein